MTFSYFSLVSLRLLSLFVFDARKTLEWRSCKYVAQSLRGKKDYACFWIWCHHGLIDVYIVVSSAGKLGSQQCLELFDNQMPPEVFLKSKNDKTLLPGSNKLVTHWEAFLSAFLTVSERKTGLPLSLQGAYSECPYIFECPLTKSCKAFKSQDISCLHPLKLITGTSRV